SSIDTSHYVRSGETVAIGGVIRSTFIDVKDAPPNSPFAFSPPQAQGVTFENSFGNIFQIFKSRNINQDKNMFIVFITPEILNSARDSSRFLRDQFNLEGVEAGAAKGLEEFE